jgi:SAM-dependent methyltransferase
MNFDYSYHYRKWHDNTPAHERRLIEYYSGLLGERFPIEKNARILDVGCGMGFVLSTLRSLGYQQAEGVDMDPTQVQAARERGLNVLKTSDTAGELRARAGLYDQIIALDLLEHIPIEQQIPFVESITVALKPGASFICTVPNANSAIASRWRYIDWTHHCSFTEHSLDFLLHTGGLREIQILESGKLERPPLWWLPVSGARHYWAYRLVRAFRRLQMMAELGPEPGRTVPLSLNLLGIARKP